jgi:sarcosine oxidase subunit beta
VATRISILSPFLVRFKWKRIPLAMPVSYRQDLPKSVELVIVGGGVIGAATAFYATRAGLTPLLLERRPRLCTLTTPVSTGAFRLQFDNREELELVRRSVELFLGFQDVTEQRAYSLDVRQQGYLFLTTDEAGAQRQRRIVALLHEWGQADVELMDGDEARRRFPYIGANVVQARLRAGDGFLDPKALTMGLAEGAACEVLTGCTATGFEVTGGRLRAVETDQGRVSAETAVIAAGPLSGRVAALAGVELPIETVLRHKLVMPELAEVPPWAPMTIDEDTGAHWRPALRGAYLLFTDPSTSPSPPAETVVSDPSFAFRLLDPRSPFSVNRIVPFWRQVWDRGAANWLVQAGQYTMTPDHRPLIGPTAIDGLHVNTGYSGHGIMAGPAGSRLLAEVMTGRRSVDQNPFRLDREFRREGLDIL